MLGPYHTCGIKKIYNCDNKVDRKSAKISCSTRYLRDGFSDNDRSSIPVYRILSSLISPSSRTLCSNNERRRRIVLASIGSPITLDRYLSSSRCASWRPSNFLHSVTCNKVAHYKPFCFRLRLIDRIDFLHHTIFPFSLYERNLFLFRESSVKKYIYPRKIGEICGIFIREFVRIFRAKISLNMFRNWCYPSLNKVDEFSSGRHVVIGRLDSSLYLLMPRSDTRARECSIIYTKLRHALRMMTGLRCHRSADRLIILANCPFSSFRFDGTLRYPPI